MKYNLQNSKVFRCSLKFFFKNILPGTQISSSDWADRAATPLQCGHPPINEVDRDGPRQTNAYAWLLADSAPGQLEPAGPKQYLALGQHVPAVQCTWIQEYIKVGVLTFYERVGKHSFYLSSAEGDKLPVYATACRPH